jgi:hypothetical protein
VKIRAAPDRMLLLRILRSAASGNSWEVFACGAGNEVRHKDDMM